MKLLNYLFAIAMILFGIYITVTSYIMGGKSALFPKITGISLLIVSVLLLIVIMIGKDSVDEDKQIDRKKIMQFIYTIILMIVYTIIIRFFGTFISTVLLFVGMATILSEENKGQSIKGFAKLLIVALVIVGVIYSLFRFVLNVPLPEIF